MHSPIAIGPFSKENESRVRELLNFVMTSNPGPEYKEQGIFKKKIVMNIPGAILCSLQFLTPEKEESILSTCEQWMRHGEAGEKDND